MLLCLKQEHVSRTNVSCNYILHTVPGPVSSMLITSIQPTSATISWSIPDYVPANYPIITYEVGYYTCCFSSVDVVSEIVNAVMNTTSLTSTINNLMSGTCYVFVVRGYTEVGPGPWKGVVGQTPPTPIPSDAKSCSTGTYSK